MKNNKFEVGDIITGLSKLTYPITSDDAIMVVKSISGSEMFVKIIGSINNYSNDIFTSWWVDNSTRYFRLLV